MPTTEDEDAAPAALQPLGKQPKGGRRKTEVDEPEPEAEEAEPEAKETERAPVPRPIIENTHTIGRPDLRCRSTGIACRRKIRHRRAGCEANLRRSGPGDPGVLDRRRLGL